MIVAMIEEEIEAETIVTETMIDAIITIEEEAVVEEVAEVLWCVFPVKNLVITCATVLTPKNVHSFESANVMSMKRRKKIP
jgi:predicted hydrolase (HD superfamily)